jgi:hypothetical protein
MVSVAKDNPYYSLLHINKRLITVNRRLYSKSMSRLFLKVSHSDDLWIPTSNSSDDLTMAPEMPVKFPPRLDGFSMAP